MANRFPLIANSSANQIQELAAGDNLDLTGSGISNVGNINASGISTLGNTVVGGGTTQLIVTGNARITGILTIGTSSITLDGSNNQVNVGTGVTLHHTNGVQVGGNTLHSTVLTVNQINASGVITATSFSGSGANLTGLAATANVTTSSLVVIGVSTVAAGSAAAPSITPTGDSNTGIFFPSADTIAFGEGGSEAARIDSSGRFGIGVTPSAKLHVNLGTNKNIWFHDHATSATAISSVNDAGSAYAELSIQAAPLILRNSTTEAMRIDSSSRVLVGTPTAPDYNQYGQKALVNIVGSEGLGIERDENSSSSSAFYFKKSRGSAVNSTTIVQNGDDLGRFNWIGTDGSNPITAAQIYAQVDGTPGANDMPGRLIFSTTADGAGGPTARMSILSTGEFRIGSTGSATVSSDAVHTIGDVAIGSVQTNLARLVMQERSNNWISFKDGTGTHYGTIVRSGGGVSYGSNSDYRLKENITSLSEAIEKIKALKPVTFNFIDRPETIVDGFLAHEVQEVAPYAVTGEKDGYDISGDVLDSDEKVVKQFVPEPEELEEGQTWVETSRDVKIQQLDPAKLVPILTAALQEALTKIETLEAKVAALESA